MFYAGRVRDIVLLDLSTFVAVLTCLVPSVVG